MCPDKLGYPPTFLFKCAWGKAAGNVNLSNYMHLVPRKITNITVSTMGRDSSVGTATRYGLDGHGIESRWGVARFSATVQTSPGPHTVSYPMGTASFRWVKRQGRGISHPSPFSAEVKWKVELYIFSRYGPSWPLLRWTLSLPTAIRPLPTNDTTPSAGTPLS